MCQVKGATTISLITHHITTLSKRTPNVTIRNRTTLSFSVTKLNRMAKLRHSSVRIGDAECQLFTIMFNVILLNVVAPNRTAYILHAQGL